MISAAAKISSTRDIVPISKPAHAFCQVPSSLKFRIDDSSNINFGEAMADQSSKVLWEASECIISSLPNALVHEAWRLKQVLYWIP